MKKQIAILGSTGSIGTQTLDVEREHPDLFSVEVLCGGSNAELLIKQALEFNPNAVIIADETKYREVADILQPHDIKVFAGRDSVNHVCDTAGFDMLVQAITGFAGFTPTYNAILAGKNIALANKESLVVGGEMIINLAMQHKSAILPVDSEHSAIFQCLQGEHGDIRRILLTASGGPFRGKSLEFLQTVTPAMALKHPTWKMGAKITIDSATLMNKGFEIIEAKLLFGVDVKQIEVVVHPQSVIHSMVEFEDGSIKAQMGLPSMKIPIQYALTYPIRMPSPDKKFDFALYPEITFEKADDKVFKCLNLAKRAIAIGGTMPTVLNAANEVAVYSFLQNKIKFTDIADIVEKAMDEHKVIQKPSFEDILSVDEETRNRV
ncbi:MAG: 1-deoxy-D-xylulose-5-phosphate reductoisomerase [Bacteroidales bacterium]|nr:1-deoxy-D-xylulose-5-phosphate reductoisomerase [Bacteroidales bacterium]